MFYRKFVGVGLAQKPIRKPPKLSEDSGKKRSVRQPLEYAEEIPYEF